MRKKHYNEKDFVIVRRNEEEWGGEEGYCRKCKADMTRFYSDGQLRHYKSHGVYRELKKEGKV